MSVVTRTKYYDLYNNLVSKTSGVIANIDKNFTSALLPLVEKMGDQINEGCWVRLSDDSIVCLDKDPSLGDDSVDTDGDGVPDVIEISGSFTVHSYNAFTMKYEDVEVWTFYSNPILADTDGDSLSDVDDMYPNHFDTLVINENEDIIEFNTGRTWYKIKCTAYDFLDNGLQMVDGHVDNPMTVEELSQAIENNSANNEQKFSIEELSYIGIVNNEGSKLYMNQKQDSFREKVFESIADRESKKYKHSGILWWEKWEETSKNAEGGFFKGAVLSEADINFSCKMMFVVDIYTVGNCLVQLGALVIAIIIVVEATPVVLANLQGLSYYVKTFGIKQGMDLYLLLGISNLPNGVISWIQLDIADGDSSIDDLIDNGIPIYQRGISGEKALAEAHPGETQKYFSTFVDGVKGGRYVDQFSEGVAYEAKVGASKNLIAMLEKYGINYIIHE